MASKIRSSAITIVQLASLGTLSPITTIFSWPGAPRSKADVLS